MVFAGGPEPRVGLGVSSLVSCLLRRKMRQLYKNKAVWGGERIPTYTPSAEATLWCTCYPGMPWTDPKSYRHDFICGIIPQLLLENLCVCVCVCVSLAMFCSLYISPSSTVLTRNLSFLDTLLLILGLGWWWGWVEGFSQASSCVSQQSG